MNLDTFLEGLPNADLERIVHGLEHTSCGLIKVKFSNMHDLVLNGLVGHNVINLCKNTGAYWRGDRFEELQEYYELNIE